MIIPDKFCCVALIAIVGFGFVIPSQESHGVIDHDVSDATEISPESVPFKMDSLEETVMGSILRLVDGKFESISNRLSSLERTISVMMTYNVRQSRVINSHLRVMDNIMQSTHTQLNSAQESSTIMKASIDALKTEMKNMEKLQNELVVSMDSKFDNLGKRMSDRIDGLQIAFDVTMNTTLNCKQTVDMEYITENMTSLFTRANLNITDKLDQIQQKYDSIHSVTMERFDNASSDFHSENENRNKESSAERRLLFETLSELNDNVLRSIDFYRHTGDLIERIVGATETVSEDQDKIKDDLKTFLEVQLNQTKCRETKPKQRDSNEIPNDLNINGNDPTIAPETPCQINLKLLESMIDMSKNRSDATDVVVNIAQLARKSMRNSVSQIENEVRNLKSVVDDIARSKEESTAAPVSDVYTNLMDLDIEGLTNMTRGIFQLSEAVAANTGWIPYIFHNLQFVEGQVNNTVLNTKRLGVTNSQIADAVKSTFDLVENFLNKQTTTSAPMTTTTGTTTVRTTSPIPMTTASTTQTSELIEVTYPMMQFLNETDTLMNKVNLIYKASAKMYRLIPSLTKLLGEPEPFITLLDGKNENEGRIEIYEEGRWGTLCADIGHDEASYICRYLGYLGGISAGNGYFGSGEGLFWKLNVNCLLTRQCTVAEPAVGDKCRHANDVAVICDHMVRLTTGEQTSTMQRLSSGFVEIHHRGDYLPVCSDNWSAENTQVVCKQLGYTSGNVETTLIKPDPYDSDQMWLSNVVCTGSENRLDACENIVWSRGECEAKHSLYIVCS